MKKILFYTANGVGLGHLKRTQLIAEEIKSKSVEIILATSSLSPNSFGKFYNHLIRLVPFSDELEENHQEFLAARSKNEQKILKAFKKFKPDLVVADFFLGPYLFVFYPLKYALDNYPVKSAFIWRLNNFKNLFLDLRKESYKLSYFDKIIIPHSLLELKDLSPSFLEKIKTDSRFEISGPIFKKLGSREISRCRLKYKISPKDFLAVITFGGGGELKENNFESPIKIINNYLNIYPSLIKKIPNLKTIVTTGPYLNNFKRKNLPGMKFIEFEKNILGLISISNLVISAVGYNTSNEIIESKTPSILIPLKREGDEQLERAKYLESKGICQAIEDISSQKLLETILKSRDNSSQMKKSFKNFSSWGYGNDKAAKIILDLL